MTSEEIEALEKLLSEATPGEWCEQEDYGHVSVVTGRHPHDTITELRFHPSDATDDWNREDFTRCMADARAIATLHSNAPALLAAAKRYEALLYGARCLRDARKEAEGGGMMAMVHAQDVADSLLNGLLAYLDRSATRALEGT